MADAVVSYKPGQDLTGVCTGAVTGGRLLTVSAARAAGENIHVAHAGAGDVVIGVAGHDAAQGEVVHIIRAGVVDLTASEAISAGDALMVAANGKVLIATGVGVAGKVTVSGDAQTDVAVTQTVTQAGAVIGVALDDIANTASGPVALSL